MTDLHKLQLVKALVLLNKEGYSWFRLCRLLGVGSVTTLYNWVHGKHLPSPIFCQKIQGLLRHLGKTDLAPEAMGPN